MDGTYNCFSVMSAVIAAKVIISEYCGRNAVILLSYPVNRKKMLGIKCLISSFLMGILSSAVGTISTAVGWKKRSAVAKIVCSLIMVCIFANCITISPGNIVWVMLAMGVVFVIIANFVYHVLADRIEKMEV